MKQTLMIMLVLLILTMIAGLVFSVSRAPRRYGIKTRLMSGYEICEMLDLLQSIDGRLRRIEIIIDKH